jgi:hypothetical protein
MKKLLHIIICMIFVSILLVGCDNDIPPIKKDVNKDKRWKVELQGEIREFKAITSKDCYRKENIDYYFLIGNEKPIIVGNLVYPELVKIGSIGKLYKFHRRKSNNEWSWFQWVPNISSE